MSKNRHTPFWLNASACGFVVIFTSGLARAGSPFLIDDPGFAENGWEIKFETIYEHDRGQDVVTARWTLVATWAVMAAVQVELFLLHPSLDRLPNRRPEKSSTTTASTCCTGSI